MKKALLPAFRTMRRRALAAVLAIVSGTLLGGSPAGAAEEPTLEHRVKAAFLYQFVGYVEWPPRSFTLPDAPVVIAVMGADAVAAELRQVVTGRTAGGRKVAVKQVRPGEPLAGVHILFIGSAESARLAQVAQSAQPRPVLTVTEAEGALEQGSMINFVIVDRRVRFEVALDSAERNGLRLSSRLLAVAQQVRTGTP